MERYMIHVSRDELMLMRLTQVHLEPNDVHLDVGTATQARHELELLGHRLPLIYPGLDKSILGQPDLRITITLEM